MKMVRNIAMVAVAASFMFGTVGFHMANNYTGLSDGMDVGTSWGVTYELNSSTSVGWDSALGMMMYFGINDNTHLRMGWTAAVAATGVGTDDGLVAETSIGLGRTWDAWGGSGGITTTLSTNLDYIMAPGADTDASDANLGAQDDNSLNLSVVIGFGF